MSKLWKVFWMTGVLAAWAAGAYANGYKVLCVKSSKATAMGEAFVAQADDPSAIAYNPAGLGQGLGNQVNVNVTVMNLFAEHTSLSGEETDIKDKWQTVPSLFMTLDTGRKDVGAGIGVSLPNGISSEWPGDSFARYVSTYSDLMVADISPAFGMRVGPGLMLGAGVNFYYSKAKLQNRVDTGVLAGGAPNRVDTESTLKGDGSTWGANVGAIYEINARHRAALTYKMPFSIRYDGDLTLAGMRNPIEATMDFPAAVVAGYAYRPAEKWKIEVNADWTDWKAVDDISIHFKTPGTGDLVQKEDLHNTVAYKIGTEYQYSERLALRAGYIYNENATPEATWRPSLPDTDIHFLTAGLGYRMDRLTVDTALQLLYYETRKIDNNVDMNEWASTSTVDGTYRSWAPCLSLSATYHF